MSIGTRHAATPEALAALADLPSPWAGEGLDDLAGYMEMIAATVQAGDLVEALGDPDLGGPLGPAAVAAAVAFIVPYGALPHGGIWTIPAESANSATRP